MTDWLPDDLTDGWVSGQRTSHLITLRGNLITSDSEGLQCANSLRLSEIPAALPSFTERCTACLALYAPRYPEAMHSYPLYGTCGSVPRCPVPPRTCRDRRLNVIRPSRIAGRSHHSVYTQQQVEVYDHPSDPPSVLPVRPTRSSVSRTHATVAACIDKWRETAHAETTHHARRLRPVQFWMIGKPSVRSETPFSPIRDDWKAECKLREEIVVECMGQIVYSGWATD